MKKKQINRFERFRCQIVKILAELNYLLLKSTFVCPNCQTENEVRIEIPTELLDGSMN